MSPTAVAVDGQGTIFLADTFNHRIRRVSIDGMITTVAGTGTPGYSGDGGPATSAQINNPNGVAVDGQGNLFISDGSNFRIRMVSSGGTIRTVAGNGVSGSSGDGGQATSAEFRPEGVAVDGYGNLFIVESGRIRKVSSTGVVTTVVGNGTPGYSGDGGMATSAQVSDLYGVAVDGQGNLFIADTYNNRVRKVSTDGIITTLTSRTYQPWGIAVDGQGNCFVADYLYSYVWRVSPSGAVINVAGTGQTGYSGDGGPANIARIYQPRGLAADSQGNIYVADTNNSAIRRLQPTNQSVLLSAVVDAASESPNPISPGKIVVLYGGGLGPATLTQSQPVNGVYPSQVAGTQVFFNGTTAPMIYTSATQLAAIVPYGITGATAQVTVTYQGQASTPVTGPVAATAPSLFALNQSGAGQAAAINVVDGSVNTAANPVKIGSFVSLYATGEGQTTPTGVDGKIASSLSLPQPNLKVSATVGGIPAVVQYAGAAPGEVAGVMQVNLQIPAGVQPGGYVPVVLQVGNASTTPDAVWIAVAN